MVTLYDGLYVDLDVLDQAELSGIATGTVRVRGGGDLLITGAVHTLRVDRSARATITGEVLEDIYVTGGVVHNRSPFNGMLYMAGGQSSGIPRAQMADTRVQEAVIRQAGFRPTAKSLWWQSPLARMVIDHLRR